jgi:hypothetical protein
MTYALRGACCLAAHALPAPIAPVIALIALTTLGLSGAPFHEPSHALYPASRAAVRNVNDGASRNHERTPNAIGRRYDRPPRFRPVQGMTLVLLGERIRSRDDQGIYAGQVFSGAGAWSRRIPAVPPWAARVSPMAAISSGTHGRGSPRKVTVTVWSMTKRVGARHGPEVPSHRHPLLHRLLAGVAVTAPDQQRLGRGSR